MRIGRTLVGVLSGALVLAGTLAALPVEQASAARGRRGGQLRLIDVDVGSLGGVRLNAIVEMRFTQPIRANTVNPAVIQIRAQNDTGTGFTKQVPGDFQVQGRIVRFFPRLPTHLRDPDDPEGGFYPRFHERDDAEGNAGFQPGVEHEIRVLGHPTPSPIRSLRGRRLIRSYNDRFTAAQATPQQFAYTTTTYQDPPPPAFQFSNPPDKVASVNDQYAQHGGTRDVPNQISITLFGTKVPISPSTLRQSDNVSMTLIERLGDQSNSKPIQGTPFIEQNFDTTRVVFAPNNALPDLASYALRVSRDVKDLTLNFDFQSNAERLRLRTMYEFLAAARDASPSTPPALLQDPPADIIFDWPRSAAERGILKTNLLALGDTYPAEVDPRVMILFSTRDEPITRDDVTIDFEAADGFHDQVLSTGSYDDLVSSSASAILTIAAGSGVDGDYEPVASETIRASDYIGHEINWRNLRIPPGVIVKITGNRPVSINALTVEIEGELRVDGETGDKAVSTAGAAGTGGPGGPGGGAGGDPADDFGGVSSGVGTGDPGKPGVDEFGTPAALGIGGQGGGGGLTGNTGTLRLGGGGGGGGGRLAGTVGARANWAGQSAWNGNGGLGGAGSSNDDLVPHVGGAGGGAGGNFSYPSSSYRGPAAGGGGGGGALKLSTATPMVIGTDGVVSARGGRGGPQGQHGSCCPGPGGPGGGGAAGSLLLRSSVGFNLANEGNATDVRGGAGGTGSGNGSAPFGGNGGDGYVRLEGPNGGLELPGGSAGFFDPVGGGVPSVVYTKWIDIGVDAARILNYTNECFVLTAVNDAIAIELQLAVEDTRNFGFPSIGAVNADQTSGNVDEVSQFLLVRVVDKSRIPGGAFPLLAVPEPNQDIDKIYDISADANGKNYRFFRYRITFQLDDTQTSSDPLPNVDLIAMKFEFNF